MAVGNYEESPNQMWNQGLFEGSSTKKHRFGTVRKTDDGRVFRYAKFTAAAVQAGFLVSKTSTDLVECTVAAEDAALAIAGAKEISVTGAGITADQFSDGWCVVTAGTNQGAIYKIRGNGATDGIGSGRASIALYDEIAATWVAASTTVTCYANPYNGVLVNPAVANEAATTAETVLGVTARATTASYYHWVQTKGFCGVVLDMSTAGNEADERAVMPGTTAGRGIVITGMTVLQVIGYTWEKADLTNAEATLVNLCID